MILKIKHLFRHEWSAFHTIDRGPENTDLVALRCGYCGKIKWRLGPLKLSAVSIALKSFYDDFFDETKKSKSEHPGEGA